MNAIYYEGDLHFVMKIEMRAEINRDQASFIIYILIYLWIKH